jgi:hypothetical protein
MGNNGGNYNGGGGGGGGAVVSTLASLPQTPVIKDLIARGLLKEGMTPEQMQAIIGIQGLVGQVPIDIEAIKKIVQGDYASSVGDITGNAADWMHQLYGTSIDPNDPNQALAAQDPIWSSYAGGLTQMEGTANTNLASDLAWFDKEQQAQTDYYNGLMASMANPPADTGGGGGGGGGGGRHGYGGGGGGGGGGGDGDYGFTDPKNAYKYVEQEGTRTQDIGNALYDGAQTDTEARFSDPAYLASIGIPEDQYDEVSQFIQDRIDIDQTPQAILGGLATAQQDASADIEAADIVENNNQAWLNLAPGRFDVQRGQYQTGSGWIPGDDPSTTDTVERRFRDPAWNEDNPLTMPDTDPIAILMNQAYDYQNPNASGGLNFTDEGFQKTAQLMNRLINMRNDPRAQAVMAQRNGSGGGTNGQSGGGLPAILQQIRDQVLALPQGSNGSGSTSAVTQTAESPPGAGTTSTGEPAGSYAGAPWDPTQLGNWHIPRPVGGPSVDPAAGTLAPTSIYTNPDDYLNTVGANPSINDPLPMGTGLPPADIAGRIVNGGRPQSADDYLNSVGYDPSLDNPQLNSTEFPGAASIPGGEQQFVTAANGGRPTGPSVYEQMQEGFGNPSPYPPGEQWRAQLNQVTPQPNAEQNIRDLLAPIYARIRNPQNFQGMAPGLAGVGDSAKEAIFSQPSVTQPALNEQDLANVFGTQAPTPNVPFGSSRMMPTELGLGFNGESIPASDPVVPQPDPQSLQQMAGNAANISGGINNLLSGNTSSSMLSTILNAAQRVGGALTGQQAPASPPAISREMANSQLAQILTGDNDPATPGHQGDVAPISDAGGITGGTIYDQLIRNQVTTDQGLRGDLIGQMQREGPNSSQQYAQEYQRDINGNRDTAPEGQFWQTPVPDEIRERARLIDFISGEARDFIRGYNPMHNFANYKRSVVDTGSENTSMTTTSRSYDPRVTALNGGDPNLAPSVPDVIPDTLGAFSPDEIVPTDLADYGEEQIFAPELFQGMGGGGGLNGRHAMSRQMVGPRKGVMPSRGQTQP